HAPPSTKNTNLYLCCLFIAKSRRTQRVTCGIFLYEGAESSVFWGFSHLFQPSKYGTVKQSTVPH
ncbi:MAG: hypothetical protein RSF73_09610, partial [Ruthenibacterium sp.]